MTRYLRTFGGHAMTVHAPRPGELDEAALVAFTAAEPVLGLDVETSALDDHGPRFFASGFTLRLVQFGSECEAWVLDMADPGQRDAAAAVLSDPGRRFVTHTPFDVLTVWSALGIPLGQRVADTHLLSKLLDPDERAGHGLKELAARHLDRGLGEAEAELHARMRALAPAGQRARNAWLRWGWDYLPADDEAYVVYAGLDAIYVRRLLPVLLTACGPFAHLARLDTWLAAQATGITVRGLRLDTGYTRALLADLEAEHAAAGQVRDLDRYTATALRGEIERVRAAVEGGRNHALNKAVFHLGQLSAAGGSRGPASRRRGWPARRGLADGRGRLTWPRICHSQPHAVASDRPQPHSRYVAKRP
jgi:DNA polymerase-1